MCEAYTSSCSSYLQLSTNTSAETDLLSFCIIQRRMPCTHFTLSRCNVGFITPGLKIKCLRNNIFHEPRDYLLLSYLSSGLEEEMAECTGVNGTRKKK